MNALNPIHSAITPEQSIRAAKALPQLSLPFQDVLDDALAQQEQRINPYQGIKNPNEIQPESAVEKDLLIAQVLPQQDPPAQQAGQVNDHIRARKLDTTPFQLFLDRSVQALEDISGMEMRVNDLIDQYLAGKASVDEVTIETQKLSMAISFATSVITSATTTFKEILQMQV